MNSSEYYIQSLELQRQATGEQTSLIAEIKNALAGSGAEQAKALAAGFEKLSKAIGNIVISTANGQTSSQGSKGNNCITIQSPYWDYYYYYYYWWWQQYGHYCK